MPYARFQKAAVDAAGNVLTNVWCEVRREDVAGSPLEPLFADRMGDTPLSNPFMAADGVPVFHAAGGAFRIRYYKAGYDETFRYVGVGLAAESDIQGFIPMGEWDDITTYAIGDVVSTVVGADTFLFASKINDNLNNPTPTTASDNAYWMWVPIGENTEVALAAAASASADAAVVSGLATAFIIAENTFATVAAASAWSPVAGPNYIKTAFYDANQAPGSGGVYRKVASEPSHYGKFSITLSGGGVVWYELAGPEVWIEQLGAVGDGVTDCATALTRAYGVGRPLRVGPGRYKLGSKVTINGSYPFVLRGAGSDVTYGVQPDNPNTTTLIGDHSGECVIEIATATAAAGESCCFEGFEISGKPSSPPTNQHGIILRARSHWTLYGDLVFSDLTGKGIAYDPSVSSYSQNVALRDSGFFNCGGAWGLTQEPANSAAYLACTLLEIQNVNFDHGVNSTSPSSYIWDFRAVREISADVFLTEGAGAVGTDTIIAVASAGSYSFDTLHHEFNSNNPTNNFYVDADTNNRYYAASELTIRIANMLSPFKFKFDASVEAHVYVADWTYYNAASVDDLVSFANNTGGHLVIERLHLKVPFTVPLRLRGQLDIMSMHNMDTLAPMLEQGATRIARWRGADGAPLSFNSHVLAFTQSNIATSAIEEDDNDTRLQVWRGTGTVGLTPTLRCQINVPFDWLEITLAYNTQTANFTVGSVLTGATSGAKAKIVADTDAGTTGTLKLKMLTATDFSSGETITDAAGGSAVVNGAVTKQGPWMVLALRWKMTIDAADVAAGISGSVTSPNTAAWSMSRANNGYNGEWQTAVMLFRSNSAQVLSSFSLAGGTPSNAVVIRVAAADLFLGRRWADPLDLSYV